MGDVTSLLDWQKRRRAILKSREGCECPNEIDGKLVPAGDRCSKTWIRCNGVLRAQRPKLDALEKAARPVTELEAKVLDDVMSGRDPWGGKIGGSRRVSQAIGRLERKGLVKLAQNRDYETVRVVTSAGIATLAMRLLTAGGERAACGAEKGCVPR